MPDLVVEAAVTELGNRNVLIIIGFQNGRGQERHSTAKGKVVIFTIMGSKGEAMNRMF